MKSICEEGWVLLKDPRTFFHGLQVSVGCRIFAYLGLKLATPTPASYPGAFLPPFNLLSSEQAYLLSHVCFARPLGPVSPPTAFFLPLSEA